MTVGDLYHINANTISKSKYEEIEKKLDRTQFQVPVY